MLTQTVISTTPANPRVSRFPIVQFFMIPIESLRLHRSLPITAPRRTEPRRRGVAPPGSRQRSTGKMSWQENRGGRRMTRTVGIAIRRDRHSEIGSFFYGQMDATHENPVVGRVGGRGWNSDEMRMRQRLKLHLKGAEGNNIRHSNIYHNHYFSYWPNHSP